MPRTFLLPIPGGTASLSGLGGTSPKKRQGDKRHEEVHRGARRFRHRAQCRCGRRSRAMHQRCLEQGHEARHPRARRQGRLQALGFSRLQRCADRHGDRHGPGRGRRHGRRAETDPGAVVEPHAVPRAGQDRHDDRHHVGPQGPARDRRHRRPQLLYLRHQRDVAQGAGADQLGGPARQAGLRQAGRVLQHGRRGALRRRDHRLHRQCRGQAGAARQEVHRLGL